LLKCKNINKELNNNNIKNKYGLSVGQFLIASKIE
jgi:hypothetical protein